MLGTTLRRRTSWFPTRARHLIISAPNNVEANVSSSCIYGPTRGSCREPTPFSVLNACATIDERLESKSARRSDNLQTNFIIPNSSTIQIKYSKGVINTSPIEYRFRRSEYNHRSRLHEFQQSRFTTSDSKSNTEDQKNKNSSSVSASSTSSTTASQAADGPLETDFANYQAEAEKAETARTQSTARRRNRSNAVFSGLDKDKEIYEHILKASLIQKEEARIRTATNVYRALCGNVVICVGKF